MAPKISRRSILKSLKGWNCRTIKSIALDLTGDIRSKDCETINHELDCLISLGLCREHSFNAQNARTYYARCD